VKAVLCAILFNVVTPSYVTVIFIERVESTSAGANEYQITRNCGGRPDSAACRGLPDDGTAIGLLRKRINRKEGK